MGVTSLDWKKLENRLIVKKVVMDEIVNIKTGLPEDRKSEAPILEQYLLAVFNDNSNGTLIFADGAIYITTRLPGTEKFQWTYFTRLKPAGLDLLKKLITEEFSKTEIVVIHEPVLGNQLLWKSELNNLKHEVSIGSGSYDSLPPVFRKIDNLINEFMYKMNEKVNPE